LAGEETRKLGLLEEFALEQNLAEALARAGSLLEGALDRLSRE
jgi:hypothetical protein